MKQIIRVILSFTFLSVYSQEKIYLVSSVMDSITKKLVPYCNVYVNNSTIGTITNSDGTFNLSIPEEYSNNGVTISFIGYKSKTISIRQLRDQKTILLNEIPAELSEVIIMPDSTLKTFLGKVYRSIEKNYPDKPTCLTGFYREVAKTKSGKFLYFAESILDVYKTDYSKKDNPGQIKVVESRQKTFPEMYKVNNIGYYGGAFLPHYGDYVKKEGKFINPKYFDHYEYKFLGKYLWDNMEVFKIQFSSQKSNGTFYINAEDYAYIRIEHYHKIDSSNKKISDISPFKWIESEYYTEYYKHDGYWQLRYCKQNSLGYNKSTDSLIIAESEFFTTSIKSDTVSPIPYEERLEYNNVFLMEAVSYDSTDWKDYNTLPPTNEMLYNIEESKEILSTKHILDKKNIFIKVLSRFYNCLELKPLQHNLKNGIYSVIQDDGTLISRKINLTKTQLSFGYGLGFDINKNLSIYLKEDVSLSKVFKQETIELGVFYKRNIKAKGKPLFVSLNIGGTFDFTGICLEDKLETLTYGKEYRTGSIAVIPGNTSYGILPGFTLSYKVSRNWEIYSSCSYACDLYEKSQVQIKTKYALLFERSYREEIVNGKFLLDGNNYNIHTPITLALHFNAGLKFQL